jgi:pimeloyl-ACP methyl ester carboxylesterase
MIGFVLVLCALLLAYLVLRTEHKELDDISRLTARGQFVELSDGLTHYQLLGSKKQQLVVMIHGFSVPDYVWEPTRLGLADAGYRVLTYDLYGRGYSDRPKADYNLELYNRQLNELLEVLNLDEPFYIVGLSMGGPIAARYTHQNADKILGLILIAPEVAEVTNGDIFPLNIPGVGEYLMMVLMEPFLLPKMQRGDFFQPELYPEWEDKYRVQLQYRGTGRALLSTVRELTKIDPSIEYQAVSDQDIPVLVIWGESDQTIPQEQIDLLKSFIPDLDLIVVENAGHLPHYEQPSFVNSLIENFIKTSNK